MYVLPERFLKIISNYKFLGLNQCLKNKCKTLYVLDTYYKHFKSKIDVIPGVQVYLYTLNSISRASQLINRSHKISVIGL